MIRRKIDKHLKEPGVTQASFCRDLHGQYHTDKAPKQLTSKHLPIFHGKKGYDKGNMSVCFYAAYCFFEKLRIKEGKPESKDRQKMEELWAERGGFDIEKQSQNKGLLMTVGEGLKNDKYGQYTITTNRSNNVVLCRNQELVICLRDTFDHVLLAISSRQVY